MNADAIREKSMTPWGSADFVRHDAPGIVSVSTPSHGGIGLSPERNAEIHKAWRNANGWYEEDCEAYIVLVKFYDVFTADGTWGDEKVYQTLHDSLHYWFPKVHALVYPKEAADRQDVPTSVDAFRELAEQRAAQEAGR